MSAFGVVILALGILTLWASWKRLKVQDVLHSLVGDNGATTAGKGTTVPSASTKGGA